MTTVDAAKLEPQLGQLIVGGFSGKSADDRLLTRIAAGELGGVVLFARNLGTPQEILALTSSLRDAAPRDRPLFVAVDQEGGRVARLKPPCTVWPPMRKLGDQDNLSLTESVGQAMGRELAALGFNVDFAPVMDIHTNPQNPVIGDRSFGTSAQRVGDQALAWARGLRSAGVLPCVKHFPGHGDTEQDSHLTRPSVRHSAERLRMVELCPFAMAAGAEVPLLMTAHVVYPAFDELPATLSERLLRDVLRNELGFRGVVVTDDLEMGSIKQRMGVAEAAVEAIRAGCDLALICESTELQEQALECLRKALYSDTKMGRRLAESLERVAGLKRSVELQTRPATFGELPFKLGAEAHQTLAWKLAL